MEYYSQWELVQDVAEPQYRTYVTAIAGNPPVVVTTRRRRVVRSKTYQATIRDGAGGELPAPSYLAGNAHVEPNPEGLSPVGNMAGEWHCDNVTYTKEQSVPMSRVMRVTWVSNGAWQVIDESSSV